MNETTSISGHIRRYSHSIHLMLLVQFVYTVYRLSCILAEDMFSYNCHILIIIMLVYK